MPEQWGSNMTKRTFTNIDPTLDGSYNTLHVNNLSFDALYLDSTTFYIITADANSTIAASSVRPGGIIISNRAPTVGRTDTFDTLANYRTYYGSVGYLTFNFICSHTSGTLTANIDFGSGWTKKGPTTPYNIASGTSRIIVLDLANGYAYY